MKYYQLKDEDDGIQWGICSICYLVSAAQLLGKVSEMSAEYFAPREDVILQNEAPSDFYIIVTGSVVKMITLSS